MLESSLRLIAIVASLFVIAGWGLFAIAEARTATDATTTEIQGRKATRVADPPPEQERARERAHGEAREVIDDVNDVLLSPFAPVTASSGSIWARRSIPALIALLVYGLGIGTLARFAAGH